MTLETSVTVMVMLRDLTADQIAEGVKGPPGTRRWDATPCNIFHRGHETTDARRLVCASRHEMLGAAGLQDGGRERWLD